ncbi:MAG TPA: hypothetical protein VMB80_18095 [Candidatus Acidoferrum sp.]|nr:hypothetical protein [Candidatus Acidoferrum sp.]
MKKLLVLLALGISAAVGSAQTAILYQETWGNSNSAATTLASVGWLQILPPAGYSGIYQYGQPVDGETSAVLPLNQMYFGGNAGRGIFFTTNGAGSGTYGETAFTSINPALYTNLEIAVECSWSWQGYNLSNWFAVEVGGTWYVATNQPLGLTATRHGSGTTYFKCAMTYNPAASNWWVLTNTTVVGIGPQAGANLSGTIDGVGIVQSLAGSSSWDYSLFTITSISNSASIPPYPITGPFSQTNYAGAGVSFAINAGGTGPLSYQWLSNGVPLVNGGRISGATTSMLSISNINAGESGTVYSVTVTNIAGRFNSGTNSPATLIVNAVPADLLYAEVFPYVGPSLVGGPVSVVGWSNSIPDNPDRLGQVTGGAGFVWNYEGYAWNSAFYTTTTSDTGASGLSFPSINPAAYPAISFAVDLNPGWQAYNVPQVYFAVQMGGANWYVSQTPLPVDYNATTVYTTYQEPFSTAANQWNTLTLDATGATIGGQPSGNLSGNITGAGLVFVNSGAGTMNFNNFRISTNAAPAIAPFFFVGGTVGVPLPQTVYVGGGASFAVEAGGTPPLSYYWQSNDVPLVDGGRFSGTRSNQLTIVNANPDDQAVYSVIVSNAVGTVNSEVYVTSGLTVNAVPAGVLYAETFPYVGPVGGWPLSVVGWANAIPDNPDRLYQNAAGDGAGYAYEASGPQATAFYTTTSLDTGASGLPFPSINTTLYGGISFSVDLAPASNPGNVAAYFAVQMNGGAWAVSANAIPLPGTASSTFTTYTQAFNPAAANWNALTLSGTGATIGGTVPGNLVGNITGVGLVTSFTGAATIDFDNLYVNTTTGVSGPGGILVNSVTGNGHYLNLSWIGSANIHMQSTTNLAPAAWVDVPNTVGQSAYTATNTAPRMFYRLIWQ